ncbi:MAG: hypothetical protein ACKV2V_11400 [Blastocatellia bacterium]
MKRLVQATIVRVICLALILNLPAVRIAQEPGAQKTTPRAWTLDQALWQAQMHPRDAYLQYVVMQLARRENKQPEINGALDALTGRQGRSREDVDLFSIFTGALAVQESLQLDTMRGVPREPAANAAAPQSPGPRPQPKKQPAGATKEEKEAAAGQYQMELREWQRMQDEYQAQRQRARLLAQKRVAVATLTGPTVKSHPWKEMLARAAQAGRKPERSPMAAMVPSDFYLAEFRSLTRLLDTVDTSDLWATHLFNQAFREAVTHNTADRLRRQLALETTPALRPFYDLVVEQIAITGSDLFLREGSDVTLLIRLRQPAIARAQLDGFLAGAEKANPAARRSTGAYLGVSYEQLSTPDRAVNVFSAWPAPDLHLRANSRVALERVIAAMQGRDARGKTVERLGDTDEYAYIRTLFPRGAAEEDGLIYLSDPFIRHLTGPALKLTENRRIRCYNHLRMIGHAALLYQTEQGRAPESLAALAAAKCAPGVFGQDNLVCPDGGRYALDAAGLSGVCSHHGVAVSMTPCLEIPTPEVSGPEAAAYQDFLRDYNQYWRTYFDPIALRLRVTARQYRLETIVLPLIDNSIYTGLASVLGGAPEPLDALPVPPRNILSLGVRVHKELWLRDIGQALAKPEGWRFSMPGRVLGEMGVGVSDEFTKRFYDFLSKGIGNQAGLHVYDTQPAFDLDLPALSGMLAGGLRGGGGMPNMGGEMMLIGAAIAALNAPVYLSVPVNDTAVVDAFLDQVDSAVAWNSTRRRDNQLEFTRDFYRMPLPGSGAGTSGQQMRALVLRFGPVSLRLFWARIGKGLYIASKPFIIGDLVTAQGATPVVDAAAGAEDTALTTGHALARMRPRNWQAILPEFQLGWAENNREACQQNLGAIAAAGRVLPTAGARDRETAGREAQAAASRFFAVTYFCPDGGQYLLNENTWQAECSLHGFAGAPRQQAAPVADSGPGKLLREFAGLTTTLTFTEEGLRAVLTIDRE